MLCSVSSASLQPTCTYDVHYRFNFTIQTRRVQPGARLIHLLTHTARPQPAHDTTVVPVAAMLICTITKASLFSTLHERLGLWVSGLTGIGFFR